MSVMVSQITGHRAKKTSKLPVTGLCEGNSPVTSEFPAQKAIKMEMFPFDDILMSVSLFEIILCLEQSSNEIKWWMI